MHKNPFSAGTSQHSAYERAVRDLTTPKKRFRYVLPLKYGDPRELVILYEIDAWDRLVTVIGDARNGCYEWCMETNEGLRYSDCGYGSPEAALLQGLVMANGGLENVPDEPYLLEHSHLKTPAQLKAYRRPGET